LTTISPSFRFSDASLVLVPDDDESKWVFGLASVAKPLQGIDVIRDRFVYVFRRPIGATSGRLHAEYFAAPDGRLFFCDGAVRENFDAGDPNAELIALDTNEISVPEDINGTSQEYFIFGTRVRLGSSGIDLLANSPPRAAQWFQVVPMQVSDAVFVPVLDPLAAALQLNRHYQEACNALLNITTNYSGQDEATARRVRDRHKALLLAKLLEASVKNAKAKTFIEAYDKEVKSRITDRDKRGASLTKFLRSDLMKFTEDLYAAQPSDFHGFLDGFGPACERLNECPNGRARLGDWLRNKPDWLRTHVLPDADLPNDTFQVARKSSAAIAQIWGELAPALFALNPKSAPEIMGSGIQRVTRTLIWRQRTEEGVVTRKFNVQSPVTKARYDQIVLIERLDSWTQSTTAARKVLERINRLVEVANLILAASALIEADSEPGFKALNLLGAGFDTVAAFGALGRLSTRKLLGVAAAAAAIDAISAAKDAKSAYDIADTSAAIGFTTVTVGSTLMFLGFASAAAGVGASATIIGLPLGVVLGVGGGILVAAGYIVAVFTADNQMDTFVKHCRFGDVQLDEDDDTKTPWSQGPLRAWRDGEKGLDTQISVLYTILASFTVKPISAQTLEIRPGLLMSDSVFKVSAQLVGIGTKTDVPARVTLEVRPRTSQVLQVGGDPVDVKRSGFVSDAAGNLVTIQLALFPTRPPGDVSFLNARSQVRVRLDLEAGRLVPRNADVQYSRDDSAFPVSQTLESKDF
jgi:hypothetical protein